jgi:hypothetical protein
MMNNLTLAIFCLLGLVLIVVGMIIPYFIFQIRCDIREIKDELKNMGTDPAAELSDSDRFRVQKSRFRKI